MRRFHFVIALLVVCLDRVTKLTVAKDISLHDSIQVVPGFFRLTHVENRGAAFGLFADSPAQWKIAMLVLFSIVALIVVLALLWRNSHAMTSTGIGRWGSCGTGCSTAGWWTFCFSMLAKTSGQLSTLPTAPSCAARGY
jgi:lipoprotein signal peptidase